MMSKRKALERLYVQESELLNQLSSDMGTPKGTKAIRSLKRVYRKMNLLEKKIHKASLKKELRAYRAEMLDLEIEHLLQMETAVIKILKEF